MNQFNHKVSIVIPTLNESQRLGMTLDLIAEYFRRRPWPWEIIVVDGGSKDETVEVAKNHQMVSILRYGRNVGKAESVRCGVLKASGNLVLIMDADSSTPIQELDKLIRQADQYDIVIASRYLPQSIIRKKQPFLRSLSSRLFRRLARWLMALEVSDTQCGFKLFKASVVPTIFSSPFIGRLSFDVEILWRAKRLGLRVGEVPVRWDYRSGSKVTPFGIVGMYRDLIRAWIRTKLAK